MKIAFLGLGRMGRELVRHLLESDRHDLILWNRTATAAEEFAATGAQLAATPVQAVQGAEAVITCLFGPDAVREVILDLTPPLAEKTLWIDISTVGPDFAQFCADWADDHDLDYVNAPVLGSLAPARAGDLGVLIGGRSASARARTRAIVACWADPERIVEFDRAASAATGKLVVNYGLAVGMQALIEAVRVGEAGGLNRAEALNLLRLPKTPLSVIAGMKGTLLESGDYSATQFSANLLAKDADLMLGLVAGQATPALTAAFAALEHVRRAGHGEEDFAAMAG